MTKAYSYCRISSDPQARGHGLKRQLEASRLYAERQGLELVESLEDVGISAYSGANVVEGALGRFLDSARAKKVPAGSTLIVESLDRLTRQSVRKAAGLFLSILDHDVTIVTLSDGHVYHPHKTDLMDIMYGLMNLERGHQESLVKGQRVSAAWAAKRRQAKRLPMTATAPAWLRLKKDRTGFEVIEKYAATIRLIFQDAASGIGTYTLTRRLNQDKVPIIGMANGWRRSYVAKILKNKAVIGEFQPHRYVDGERRPDGDPVPNYFPAIVPEELFYRVQDALRQRRGLGGRKGGPKGSKEILRNLFSGLARCHYCGAVMKFENKGTGPKGGSYLVCDRARRGMGCEKKTRWRYEHFEASFLTFVTEVNLASVMSDDSGKRATLENEMATLRGRLVELEADRDRTYNVMLKSKTTSVDYIARKLDEIEHELIKLNDMLGNKEQELRELDGLKEAIEETKPLIAKLQHHDGETYKLRSMIASRLRRIVHRISVAPLGQAPDIRESIEGLRARKLPDSDKTADFWERELGKEERWHHRFFEVRFNDKQVLPGTGSESEQSYTTLVVYSSDDDPTRVRIGSDLWHHDETEMVDYDEKPSWGGWY